MARNYRVYGSDTEKLKVYDHRIRLAENFNQKWHPMVRAYWDRYEAHHTDKTLTGNGHYVSGATPMVIGNIDSQFSSMTSADIDITVTPKGNTTEDEAYVTSAALSEEVQLTKMQDRGNVAVKDSLIGGLGFVKVGYEYHEQVESVPRVQEDVVAEVNDLIRESDGKLSHDEVIKHVPLVEDQVTVLSDRVVVDYVPWDMLLWDPTAKQWNDLSWVAQKDFMEVEEVKQDPLFQEYTKSRRNGKKLEELKPDSYLDETITGKMASKSGEDERVTVYTIFDFQAGTVCVWAKGTKFLLYETVNPFSLNKNPEDKNPFVPIILRATSSRVRGISELDVLKDVATEKDLYHSQLATILERVIPKIMAEEGSFTQAGINAISSQEIGAVVELRTGKGVADVKEFPVPSPLAEMFMMPDRLEQMARDATGVSELQRGLFPDRKRTATETTEVVAASATRASEKRNALEGFWLGVSHRILQLMQMFYEKERIIRMSDDEVDIPWEYTAEDIAGSYGLEISLTPKETKSWQNRRDDALATVNIIGPMAQPGPDGSTPVDVTELLRWALTEMNIPRRVIRALLNLPEEQQVQMMNNLQSQAGQAQAQQGQVRSDMVPGPLSAPALAAASNQGTIPPELLAAAGGINPATPGAVEQVSESAGITQPGF
jgi:hypothetical protein